MWLNATKWDHLRLQQMAIHSWENAHVQPNKLALTVSLKSKLTPSIPQRKMQVPV